MQTGSMNFNIRYKSLLVCVVFYFLAGLKLMKYCTAGAHSSEPLQKLTWPLF